MVQDLEYIQMSAPHDMQKFGIGVEEEGGWDVINLEKPVISVSVNYLVQCFKHFLLTCPVILR
jgi:alpha-L-arabinofuranosidase